ncbi:MAG: FimB/Mfa2 family fimbrial subunit [Muribaculaceae bacterium]|nr:FimB/Mfa2 family fimbrial subunit [Muribaculaceae bacterium]
MTIFNKITSLILVLILGGIIGCLSSCSMVNEDFPECAPAQRLRLKVNFEYTYNTKQVDWFNNHVGSVYLYVFDKDGIYVYRDEKNKTYMDYANPDFSMEITDEALIPGETYKFVAVAQGNHAGYDASKATPGFQLVNEMKLGESTIDKYRLKLDRDGDGIYDFGVVTDDYGVFNWKEAYENNRLRLDTLWCTQNKSLYTIPEVTLPDVDPTLTSTSRPDVEMEITIPMMRVTNTIKVNLVHSDFTKDFNPNDFNIIIDFPNGNGTIDFVGNTYPAQELMYLCLRKEMRQYQAKDKNANYDAYDDDPFGEWDNHLKPDAKSRADSESPEYSLYAEFGLSRLQESDGSFLQVTDAYTGREVCRIENFSDWLATYFQNFSDDYPTQWDSQEFLDREYDYTIDIKLKDTETGYEWYQIGCSILGWCKREYSYTFQ